jgi:hypothetical protein
MTLSPELVERVARAIWDFCNPDSTGRPLKAEHEYNSRCARAILAALLEATHLEEVVRLREALTPSADTKAAYLGEFKMTLVRIDECGDEYTGRVTVSWDTIKEIMAAISKRAALTLFEVRKSEGA